MLQTNNLPSRVRVGNKWVGEGESNFIIAEIGNNHNGDLELAKKQVHAAYMAGADAVKFQKRDIDEVFTKEMQMKPQTNSRLLGTTYGEYRRKLEIGEDDFKELKKLAHSCGMAFFATPFDLKSAALLARVGMDAWKIASFDIINGPLLEFVARTREPIFISTGTASVEEIDEAIETMLKFNNKIIINHCVSIYPTPDDELNLGAVPALKARYAPLPIGYSGHEIGFIPTLAAVTLGACAVERHFTNDKSLPGPDQATVSLDPLEFGEMVRQIRRIEKAVSDKKIYQHEKEVSFRNKHGKSVVSRVKIPAGTLISSDMLTCKSPGHGIKPTLMHTVIGKKADVDIPEDTVLLESQLS